MSTTTRVSGVQPITPHNAALYDAGKKLLVDSVDVSREFCKLMITTSLSAVPIYLALLQLAIGKEYHPTFVIGALFVFPAALFLVSAIVSVFGYLPGDARFSLDLPEEIESTRSAVIRRRLRAARVSLLVFSAAALSGVALTVWAFTLRQ